MRTIVKCAAAVALAGTMAVAAASPSQARYGRNAAAIGGFAAGALVGAAAANAASTSYYGPGYYYEPGYTSAPAYAYEPAPVYVAPAPRYYYRSDRCWHVTDSTRGYGYYGAC
jgi:hypothetical protein